MRISKYLLIVPFLVSAASVTLGQPWAVESLEESPRHHEWVEIPADGRTVHAFAAYPESADPSPALIVIHENRGLTDWVRSFADKLAEAGYLAVAPDLLSDFDDQHGRTSDFEDSDAARSAIYELDSDQVITDLQDVQAFVSELPASTGEVAVVGFCWGGSQAFRFATYASDLATAFVFYGSPPSEDRMPHVSAPIYGFYGEHDERINATIPDTEQQMEEHGHTYDYEIYEGAGHAFMRQGDDPEGSPEAAQARDQAWERLMALLEGMRADQ